MTWITMKMESDPEKVNAALERARANDWTDLGTDFRTYTLDDDPDREHFMLWMMFVNRRFVRNLGLGVFDVGDYLWHDAFDDGSSPAEAVASALEWGVLV